MTGDQMLLGIRIIQISFEGMTWGVCIYSVLDTYHEPIGLWHSSKMFQYLHR